MQGESEQKGRTLEDFAVKSRLAAKWRELKEAKSGDFTPVQRALFPALASYKDVLHTNYTPETTAELQHVYLLHALNHMLKNRDKVIRNNQRLHAAADEGRDIGEKRDQGFTRPKVLILTHMKNRAFELIEYLQKLAPRAVQERVHHRKRFLEEFAPTPDEAEEDDHGAPKPADYKELFKGNIDDCFRIGVIFANKTIRLYAKFYSADLIVASPLGLRMIIGAEGDKGRDYDYLSSVEMVIVDGADVMLMQNWDHVRHVFEHMNLAPKESRDTDFSRVREWYLNGWAKHYRQTVLLSAYPAPEFNALFAKFAANRSGTLRIRPPPGEGSLAMVVPQLQQIFVRVDCASPAQQLDARFTYFTQTVLPRIQKATQNHILIFIPSYLDYVRIRNYLTERELSFASCCEYTKPGDVSRNRSDFFHGLVDYLLVTERFQFFRRYRIRGAKTVCFYSAPDNAHFYPEILNAVDEAAGTSYVVYTKFDLLRLERLVGTTRARRMLSSEKTTHLFV